MIVARDNQRFTRKRLLLVAGSVATLTAAGVFTASATFGLFKATRVLQSNTFSTGTVTLTGTAGGTCSTTNMFPGAAPAGCTLTATYTGSVPAYLAVDILIETQAGNGGTKLYNPSDSTNGLQVTVSSSSPSVTYTIPTVATTCPGSAPAGSTCYELDNELIRKGVASNGTTAPFSTSVSLPSTAPTGYRGGSAQVILTVHAVQSGNNSFTNGCSTGSTCGVPGNWR